MVRLPRAPLAALALACAARGLAPGQAVPAEWMPGGGGAAPATPLVWVFRTEDCRTCQGVDYPLRRLQASHGPAVPLVAVHVGAPDDSAVARAFFARKRLRVGRLVTVRSREFRRRFPGAELPAFYLVRDGRVAWSSTAWSARAPGLVRLDSLVEVVRGEASRE